MESLAGKNVLVTGATGFVGSRLSERLIDEGANVFGLGRDLDRVSHLSELGVKLEALDLRDSEGLHKAVQGKDIIFHTAAAMGTDADTAYAVNVMATENLMRFAADSGIGRCVYVSTVGVYDMKEKQEVDESTPLAVNHPATYPRTKAQSEVKAREAAEGSDLELVILRPSMIYGPGYGVWTVGMLKNIKEGNPVYLGDGSAYFNPVFIDDVINALLLSAAVKEAGGEDFNISAGATTWKEFMSYYGGLCGEEPKGIPVFIARLMVWANKIPGVRTPLDEGALEMSTSRKIFPIDKAQKILGWEPKTDLEEGMQKTAAWLKENGLIEE